MTRFLSIILNPTSGARTSTSCAFFPRASELKTRKRSSLPSPLLPLRPVLNETLLPLLEAYNASLTKNEEKSKVEWEILTSESEGDGERLGGVLRARSEAATEGKSNVQGRTTRAVVMGGDGTSHGRSHLPFRSAFLERARKDEERKQGEARPCLARATPR